MKHNPKVVEAFWRAHGLPPPEVEFAFHPTRKWRFDYAWADIVGIGNDPSSMQIRGLALEVQGGAFIGGRHVQGGALRKEHEKLNSAAILGWRILYVFPEDLLKTATANMVKKALNIC